MDRERSYPHFSKPIGARFFKLNLNLRAPKISLDEESLKKLSCRNELGFIIASKWCVTMRKDWAQGDWVVYRKSKRSSSPGPRAAHVNASSKGESYTYTVDKFWVVDRLLPDGQILLRTSTGKTNVLMSDDPNLRRAGILQRFFWRSKFRDALTHCVD